MNQYLQKRLEELRKKYKETGDIKWLHRFNECRQIQEKLIVMEMDSKKSTK